MLIALDIGNTNIKSAFFADNQLTEFTTHSKTNEAIEYINKTTFKEAAICSVNPTSQKIVNNIILAKCVSIFEVNVKNKFNLSIKYETPETLGMDRVCSAVGALSIATNEKLISKNQFLITIDFGTATTINIVTPDRQFIGGLIIPGIKTMLNSLNKKTAQLPLPDLQSYQGVIGNSTNSSIINGVITATIGSINETVNKIREDSKQDPVIFVTGGNARFILPHIKNKVIFDEILVLKGLKLIYDMNK
ncbi:MAG: type III pantothenate kinase [Ignavibacteriaceae bacterium]|nr:type III pantothenate kinase [Ignavibacteriaceae bacterium]